jgi:hypothetical protein
VHERGGGLYYFNARWYDSSTGRFTSEDPVRDGINWFVYVGNNPMVRVDPSGLNSEFYQNLIDAANSGDSDAIREAASKETYDRYHHLEETSESAEASPYAIPVERLEREDWTITYYEQWGDDRITIDGESAGYGEEYDFGSEYPFGAYVDVPDDAYLEIQNDRGEVIVIPRTGGPVRIGDYFEAYNDVVESDEFAQALRQDRAFGVGEMVVGGIVFAGSALAATKLNAETGGTAAVVAGAKIIGGLRFGGALFATGLARACGANAQSIAEDLLLSGSPLIYAVVEEATRDGDR